MILMIFVIQNGVENVTGNFDLFLGYYLDMITLTSVKVHAALSPSANTHNTAGLHLPLA